MISIEVWNQDATERLSVLTNEAEVPVYSHINPGGCGTFTCDIKRDPRQYHRDLVLTNIIKIFNRDANKPVWEGEITNPNRKLGTDLGLTIEASGLVNWMTARINVVGFSSGLFSTWLTANMLPALGYAWAAGSPFSLGEFSFPTGIDISQHKTYRDLMDYANACMGWNWGVDIMNVAHKPTLYFEPQSATPDYYVDIEDCETDMDYVIDGIFNCIRYDYTTDGTNHTTGWYPNDGNPAHPVPDTTSKALYRRRDYPLDISETVHATVAQQIILTAFNQMKVLRPASTVKAWKVYAADGLTEVPIEETKSGKLLFLRGLFPASQTIANAQMVNEMSTFPIAEAKITSAEGYVEFSPAAVASTLENMLADLSALAKQ